MREDMVGGTFFVYTRKAVVEETFIRDLKKLYKSPVGNVASQFCPNSKCQAVPNCLNTKWELDSESSKNKRAKTRREVL